MRCNSVLVLGNHRDKINELVSQYKSEFFKKGDYVLVNGEILANKFVFILINGTVAYFYENDDQRNYLFSLNSKEAMLINSFNFFYLSDIEFSIKAMEDCEILMIPKVTFLEDKLFFTFFKELDVSMGVVFDKMIKSYSYLRKESLEIIVYNYLLHINTFHTQNVNERNIFISRNDLSLDLGYSRETVSRALKKLEDEGKIIRKTRSIELLFN